MGADVSIKLRRITQGVTKVIAASTPNDGSFTWFVTGLNSAQNWIAEIASVFNPAIVDQSDNTFRISN